jgi:hypothetical protein
VSPAHRRTSLRLYERRYALMILFLRQPPPLQGRGCSCSRVRAISLCRGRRHANFVEAFGRRAGRKEGGYGCAWCEARDYEWDEGGGVSFPLGGGTHSRGCCSELRALKYDILGKPRSRATSFLLLSTTVHRSVRIPSLRWERNSSERSLSRDIFDIFFFGSSLRPPLYRLVFDNKTPFKLDDRRVLVTTLPVLTAPFFFISPFFPSLASHSNNTYRHNATTVPRGSRTLSFSNFLLVVPLCLHLPLLNHHHRRPRGHRYYTKLRHS